MQTMQIKIHDDFDLKKIISCGQCFRAKEFEDGRFRFITGDHVLYIQSIDENSFTTSCEEEEWNEVWTPYFDLMRDYRKLREKAYEKHEFVQRAMDCGCGIRILHQDPWEMLVTFIISQRKSIPAIAKSVEALAERFGHVIETGDETLYSFPTPDELCDASEEELKSCGLGYRTPYVSDAIRRVVGGALDLKTIASYGDEELFQELLTVHGVGKKVADCVCLFGYGRTARAPIDVWIDRAIREECHGENPFPLFGGDAGIIQQYIFYYEKTMNKFVNS